MLDLPQLTLCAVDTRTPALALQAMARCMAGIRFGRCVFLTQGQARDVPCGIEAFDIGTIDSGAAYSGFVLRQLPQWVLTSHVLLVQWDGFVCDASRWEDGFLQVDYLGAPWGKAPQGHVVGNGGFSLRSRRLLLALQDPALAERLHHPEDVCIAQSLRPRLEREHGIVFGSPQQAARFAYENESPPGPTFGFHGLFNLPRVLPQSEMAALLDALPDPVARGRDAFKLARALLRCGMPALSRRLLQRRQSLGATDLRERLMLARTRWAAGADQVPR
jgi:hypothetical protein